MKTCSTCGKPAVINRKHEGRHLCEAHFFRSFEKKAKATMSKFEMVDKNDIICVALSGGKDSCAVLYFLNRVFGKRPDIKIFALTIDEGIKGYRDESIGMASKLCRKLGIEHHVVSFKDEFGKSLDEKIKEKNIKIHSEPMTANPNIKSSLGKQFTGVDKMLHRRVHTEPPQDARQSDWEGGPCTYCGVARRFMMNKYSRKFGATKLATGHNLDDEVQSILMDYINGNLNRASRMGKTPDVGDGLHSQSGAQIPINVQNLLAIKKSLFIPRIKPFREIPEKEVALYAELKDMGAQFAECPYVTGIRFITRDFINDLEANSSGTKFTILETFQKILPHIKKVVEKDVREGKGKLVKCEKCGEPSSMKLCKTCELWRSS